MFTASADGFRTRVLHRDEAHLTEQQTVLVVEDEEAIQRLVAETLGDEGYEVLTCADAAEATAILASRDIALILLDLLLGNVDGAEFAAAYVARTPHPAPVVLLTAREDNGERPPGVVAYLQKPFDLDDLLQVVHDHASAPSSG